MNLNTWHGGSWATQRPSAASSWSSLATTSSAGLVLRLVGPSAPAGCGIPAASAWFRHKSIRSRQHQHDDCCLPARLFCEDCRRVELFWSIRPMAVQRGATFDGMACGCAQAAANRNEVAERHEKQRLPEPGFHLSVPRMEVLRSASRPAHQGTTQVPCTQRSTETLDNQHARHGVYASLDMMRWSCCESTRRDGTCASLSELALPRQTSGHCSSRHWKNTVCFQQHAGSPWLHGVPISRCRCSGNGTRGSCGC